MKKITKYIPNTLTCISLIFGFYAAILGITGNYFGAMCAIFTASLFDFLDGFAARMLHAYSPMGKELDSLSDVISFGVAPGMMLFSFLDNLLHSLSWNDSILCKSLLLTAFAIPVFSALRLAKFNIDERQKTSFIGLPVPANAIFWSALITAFSADVHASYCIYPLLTELLTAIRPEIMLFILSITAIISSLLLVSEIKLFSLKMTSLSLKANKYVYILFASTILFVAFFGILGVAAVILFYILLGVSSQHTN